MVESFKVTLSQVFVLFVFITIGYIMKKSGKIPDSFNKGISNLLVWIFMPFLNFGSMADNFRLNVLAEKKWLLLISVGALIVSTAVAFVFSRIMSKSPQTRDVYMYSFMFPNTGYFGNPLVLAVFGELLLFDFMIFGIPFCILTYTFGVYILNPNSVFNLKNLINPIMVSLVLGIIVGGLEIEIPSVVRNILDVGASCLAPSAMILVGIVFASNNLKSMVTNVKAYIACAIKMIVLPVIAIFIMAKINVPHDIATILIITFTLPTGLNSIIFPEAYGGDSKTGAQLCFVSTLTCLVFMPIALSLYESIT